MVRDKEVPGRAVIGLDNAKALRAYANAMGFSCLTGCG